MLTQIGGMDVEPFTIVCASPEVHVHVRRRDQSHVASAGQVAVFRMDLTDARNRIPTDLREALAVCCCCLASKTHVIILPPVST